MSDAMYWANRADEAETRAERAEQAIGAAAQWLIEQADQTRELAVKSALLAVSRMLDARTIRALDAPLPEATDEAHSHATASRDDDDGDWCKQCERYVALRADPGARAALLAEWADTDPQALLDALTRAGVLDEVWRWHSKGASDNYGFPRYGHELHRRPARYKDHELQRRLATVWREVSP